MKKHKLQTIRSNAIDPATSPIRWGKHASKKYLGCAGKGGDTTNFEIPAWIFERELLDYKEGVLDA